MLLRTEKYDSDGLFPGPTLLVNWSGASVLLAVRAVPNAGCDKVLSVWMPNVRMLATAYLFLGDSEAGFDIPIFGRSCRTARSQNPCRWLSADLLDERNLSSPIWSRTFCLMWFWVSLMLPVPGL